MAFKDILGALGIGGDDASSASEQTRRISDYIPQEITPNISDLLKGTGLENITQSNADLRQLDNQNIQAQNEATQAQLDDLRQAQGDYESSQNPWYKQLYKGALDKAGGAGSAIKNFATSDLGKKLGGAALETGAGLIGQSQLRRGQEQYLTSYDEALKRVQEAQKVSPEMFNAVKEDPEQMAMRQQALKGLSQRAEMGLTPEDQAALASINRQAANQFRANQATIGQEQARRGVQLGGLGLAQSMGAADQALQNQALAGQNQAAMSFQAKQNALQNLGNQTNQALQSDYARQIGKAENLSHLGQFNAQQQAQANQLAANTMLGKGQLQQQIAAGKAASTGQLGQVASGLINPNQQVKAQPQPTQAQQPQQKKPGQV
jgi:hypothetical protein